MFVRRISAVVLLAGAVFGSAIVPSAQGAVSRSERNAVVFVAPLESAEMSALDRGLYDTVELAAYGGARAILSPAYGSVLVTEGSGATLAKLRTQLRGATNRAGVRAVDLIFVTHGATSRVFFADGARSMATVRDTLLNGLSAAQRAKLRMVFSTACFGATHRASWLAAGFDVASGASGISPRAPASWCWSPIATSSRMRSAARWRHCGWVGTMSSFFTSWIRPKDSCPVTCPPPSKTPRVERCCRFAPANFANSTTP